MKRSEAARVRVGLVIPALTGALLLAQVSASAAAAPADLIVHGGVIYTVDSTRPRAQAMAVSQGRFVAVGSDSEVAAFKGPKTQELDLQGRAVVPGFIDSHTHIHEGGEYVSGVQLRDARTLAEVQRRLADYARAHPDKPWIIGEAWSYGYPDMPDGQPTRQMLDKVVSDRPVLLGSGMAHAGWVNSRALEVLKITAATPDPKGGFFVRDAHGQPTGWLKEYAWDQVRAAAPRETAADNREIMRNAMSEAARYGITRLVSCGGDWDMLPLLAQWERQGRLITRFSISDWVRPEALNDDFYRRMAAGRSRYRSDWVRVDAVKFIEDGVIESHTALMPDGYHDNPREKGVGFFDAAVQRAAVLKLNGMGLQVYTHAIGDGAIRQTLDAYQAAAQTLNKQELRNRIEHYEAPYAADIERLVRLQVVASMQPAMIYPKDQWMGMQGLWQKYAGDARAARAFPIHSVLARGGHVAFGTDWPIIDLNPMLGLRDAVLRQSFDGEPRGGWVPAERISLEEALRAYTLGAAYAARRERDEGSIAPGKLADFVVLSEDLFRIPVSRIQDVKVLHTFVAGRAVYDAAAARRN